MVLDGPNVDPKLPKAARRASGMPWGPSSKGCAPENIPRAILEFSEILEGTFQRSLSIP